MLFSITAVSVSTIWQLGTPSKVIMTNSLLLIYGGRQTTFNWRDTLLASFPISSISIDSGPVSVLLLIIVLNVLILEVDIKIVKEGSDPTNVPLQLDLSKHTIWSKLLLT